ncbi:MAG: DUF4230 domain-containing protein [Clostridia bacterium]|nr:DUF4230 domain-containing protein [Clostridia bacterium]MBQ6374873.1 DUF4230 domain-containing protein [Clostridia bacterium]
MEKTASKKTNREKIELYALLVLGIILMVFTFSNLTGIGNPKLSKQESHSNLINTKEIAALSVSEFVYNGIAQSFKSNGEPDYNVFYKSTVKVSIDANNIDYTFNEKEKVVTFIFPEITLEKPVIDVGSVSIIPNRSNLYMDEVISLCRVDALEEAKKSLKLILSAQENIRTIIEAWYSPVLEGYAFEFQFSAAEGGDRE